MKAVETTPNSRAPNTCEEFDNRLDLGVIKRICRRIGIDTHGVDGTLVARVRDVAVEGVGLKMEWLAWR
jgi:hypothetical protein